MAEQEERWQQSNRYSLLESEIRPVTESDIWCRRKMPKGRIPAGDDPWGYVITIPYCPNQNTFLDYVDGYIIIRTKKDGDNFLLQVIEKKSAPNYGIKAYGIEAATKLEPNASSKKRKNKNILSIKNLTKSAGNWGKAID